jgi:putative oxygen-independent coproporphyrinogen III oxidase
MAPPQNKPKGLGEGVGGGGGRGIRPPATPAFSFRETTVESAGLYLHVPFCVRKCRYCDFVSVSDLTLLPAWLAALEQEMGWYRDFAPAFDTLYLGGGTPSLLAESHLEQIFTAIHQLFRIAPGAEVTLEANPDDLTLNKLKFYRNLGINRLSLGVQSFSDGELTFLGRRHSAAQACRVAEWAREAGIPALSLDLIYALPGQSPAAWQRNLHQALQFQPEHLSCYQLTLASGTPLAQERLSGAWQEMEEERQREFFLFTSVFLESAGYVQYEVSNFARGEEYRSRHNLKYWRHDPYLGLGPAAHSYQERRRWWNLAAVAEYCRRLREGHQPLAGEEVLTPEQLRLEALALGLRTREGVELAVVRQGLRDEREVERLVQAGLVTVDHHRLRPTREGLVVADHLALLLGG